MKQQLINHLTEVCEKQKLHPTETLPYVRKQVKEGRWKGEINPEEVVLETQRFLNQKHPKGYL
jgi:hypothetical protein